MFAGCRCPRCADSILVVREVEGRKVLACRTCAGAFVGAKLGLRLLAVLNPDVPPPRHGIPSPACPVCRTDLRRVLAADLEVETCKTHGVWFDAGDLPQLVRAVSKALGKEVPSALETLEETGQREAPTSPPAVPPPTDAHAQPYDPSRKPDPVRQRTTADEILDVVDVVTSPLETAAEIALFPFRVTLGALELACGIVDVLD